MKPGATVASLLVPLLVGACDVSAGSGPEPERLAVDASARCLGGPPRSGFMPCECDTDCVSLGCPAPDIRLPSVARLCVDPCEVDDECGAGQVCTLSQATEGPIGVCVDTCRSSGDCPGGTACNGEICLPWCSDDSDCSPRRQCDPILGSCFFRHDPSLLGLSEPCVDASDCQSRLCGRVRAEDPQGRCFTFCRVERPSCPAGSTCLSVPGTDLGGCVLTCRTANDCPDGLICVRRDDQLVCLVEVL